MKIISIILLISNIAFSQYRNPYGNTISTVQDAERNGQIQLDLQNRFDYNNEKIQIAIDNLIEKISNLDYPDEVIINIKEDLQESVNTINDYLKKNPKSLLNNSLIDSIITKLYNNVNTSIRDNLTEYKENYKDTYDNKHQIDTVGAHDSSVFFEEKSYPEGLSIPEPPENSSNGAFLETTNAQPSGLQLTKSRYINEKYSGNDFSGEETYIGDFVEYNILTNVFFWLTLFFLFLTIKMFYKK